MKKYETPSYEVEYFKIHNEIFTRSENAGNEVDDPVYDDNGPGIM